jgi:hypothetical protein
LIIYITKLGKYSSKQSHWKFIAVLEVIAISQNHNIAMAFYTNNNLPVSQNVMCSSTTPFPFDMSHGKCGFKINGLLPKQIINKWNARYQFRANHYPALAITQIWQNHIYLNNPSIIDHQMMQRIFGRIPGTQNPPKISATEWTNFRNELKI